MTMRLRAPTFDDAPAVLAVLVARDVVDFGAPDYTLGDLHDEWSASDLDLAADVTVAEDDAGAIVGYAAIHRPGAFAVVAPDREGRGIGTRLLQWTEARERELGRQFHAHTVVRRYLAVVPGYVPPQTVRSFLVRDRGDGRRGSTTVPGQGKEAITHIAVAECLPGYTVLSCRLETGRTHQIRIHLAELGHPVCGDPVYHVRRDGTEIPDGSGAPRLALHAVELGFRHLATGEELHWEMPLPDDLRQFVRRLGGGGDVKE